VMPAQTCGDDVGGGGNDDDSGGDGSNEEDNHRTDASCGHLAYNVPLVGGKVVGGYQNQKEDAAGGMRGRDRGRSNKFACAMLSTKTKGQGGGMPAVQRTYYPKLWYFENTLSRALVSKKATLLTITE
jgi:hypothetical protein